MLRLFANVRFEGASRSRGAGVSLLRGMYEKLERRADSHRRDHGRNQMVAGRTRSSGAHVIKGIARGSPGQWSLQRAAGFFQRPAARGVSASGRVRPARFERDSVLQYIVIAMFNANICTIVETSTFPHESGRDSRPCSNLQPLETPNSVPSNPPMHLQVVNWNLFSVDPPLLFLSIPYLMLFVCQRYFPYGIRRSDARGSRSATHA